MTTEYANATLRDELRERLRPKTPEEIRQWAEAEQEDRAFRAKEWREHVRRQRLAKSRQLIQERTERGRESYY
jgi:hypothetical protein